MKIQADDLMVGELYTILDNKPFEPVTDTQQHGDEVFVMTKTIQDHSGYGKVMVLAAVDLPYCIVRCFTPFMAYACCIDIRRTNLQKISFDYAMAALMDNPTVLAEMLAFIESKKKEQSAVDEYVQNSESIAH